MTLDAKVADPVRQGNRQTVLSKTSTGWQASLLRSDNHSYRIRASADTVEALHAVLDGYGGAAAHDEDLIG